MPAPTTAAPEKPPDLPGLERRAWVRYPCSFEASCHAVASAAGVLWSAKVLDISAGGLRLVVSRRFEIGTVLRLEVHSGLQQAPWTFLARVIHARPQTGGDWALGCAFARELDEEDLRAFNAEKAKPAPPDCRAWLRFPCAVDAACSAVGEHQQERWAATVLNISASGVGLRVTREFEPRALVSLELPAPADKPSRTVLARVVHVTPDSIGHWIVGCAFEDRLSDEELRSIL